MKTENLRHVSRTAWLEHLGSPQARVRVRLGVVPGRFRTPPEWDTRSRRLQEHLVYFFARDSARAEVAGDSFLCPRGSCCWVTPGTLFRFFSDQSPLVWRFRFSVTAPGKTRPIAPEGGYYFLPGSPAVAETINALLLELPHHDQWQPAALRSWLIQLSILFFRSSKPPGKQRVLTPSQQNVLTALMEKDSPDRFLTPRDLAKATGLSLDYFSRVFHRSYRIPPRQWLVQQRLSYAVVLLQETPLRIGEIAQRLGYANPHLFTRQFSAFFGRSPRSYRV